MTKKDKNPRPKARLPRGFHDRRGPEVSLEREMLAAITKVYESYGFDPLETPAFEYTDALGKFLPDVDRPNAGVFSLQDDDEQWMSLRYDLTAPLARHVAENYDGLPKPFRRYAVGPVWRNEKPGPGRFRQFTQCDADTVGAPAPHADAEMCMMFSEALAEAIDAALASAHSARGVDKAEKPYVRLRVSNRKLVDGLFEAIELSGEEERLRRLTVMRSMDKFDRLGTDGVALLLGAGRRDESGDFTAGAKLDDSKIQRVLDFLNSSAGAGEDAPRQSLDRIADVVGGTPAGAAGVAELDGLAAAIPQFETRKIIFDCAIIRGLEYYTGPVFEAEFVSNITGRPWSLGSVGGGGRYDGLVARFKGIEVPAVGISVGVSRLVSAFEFGTDALRYRQGPVVILALEGDQMANYQSMAARLRAAKLRAEVYVGGGGMKAQMKYADKRGAPVVVLQGEDERARKAVSIKDMVAGKALAGDIAENEEWRAKNPGQFECVEDDLVMRVAEVIDRQKKGNGA